MEISEILSLVTFVVTLVCGVIAKKHPKISNNIIPIQNMIIGIIMTIVDFIITKDFSTSVAVSGLLAGGTYDLAHNLEKIRENSKGE